MRFLAFLRTVASTLFARAPMESEIEEELRAHIADRAKDLERSGLTRREADRQARIEFGGYQRFKEECRDASRVNLIDDLLRDLRYAGRNLRRSPGFAAITVLIMALGIGANTAVFSVVNAVVLKPLAYPDADRIVTLARSATSGAATLGLSRQISIPNFKDWRDQSSSFGVMAYYAGPREGAAMPGSTAEYVQVTRVSPEFFRIFAVEPRMGRFFTADESKQGSGGALMLSYAYWQSHFGGDPGVLGKTVRLYGRALPIAGVLPPGFGFPNKTDLWYPTTIFREPTDNRSTNNYLAVGRLKPGASLEQAQAEMTSIAQRLEQQYPESNQGWTVRVTRIRDELLGDARLMLYLLLGAVSVVLLIACANTATLLLGKATVRTREVAVRMALGASRRRVVRQLITESLLLALLAGVLGLLLAYWGSKALVALAPADLPRLAEIGIDRWVLAFTLGVSMITSLLFGLVPSIYAAKVDFNDALKQGATRSVLGGGMGRLRGALVVAEIALAVVLLSGAGLLVKSLVALHQAPLGFRPENVLVMRARGPGSVRDANLFFRDLLAQITTLPGVLAAGATMAPPGSVDSDGSYFIDRLPAQLDPSGPSAVNSIVTPGTFAALGIPVKSGRDFDDNDIVGRPTVAVVNESLVRRSFAGQNPIGRTIFCLFDSSMGMEIVGVTGDVRQRGPAREPMPECYMPYRQHRYNDTTLSIVTRTAGDPNALSETLRRLVRERSAEVPVTFTTMEARLSENVAAPRFRTVLFGIFAGVAVFLAMAGVYGVMSYAIGQRRNEIGLRMALGASTDRVLRLILAEAMLLASIGLALGLAAAVVATRLLRSMLFQVKPNDPVVYLAVALLLGLVALLAGYVPAWRASRIDPLTAIRQE